jgi:putative ABC transport system ATP-binding protein
MEESTMSSPTASPRLESKVPLIELRGVVKVYTGLAGSVTALDGIDMQVFPGEFLMVTGKSGAGKSTLINIVAGLDRATSGEIVVAGTALQALNAEHVARLRGRTMGVVFQSFELLPTLTALQNVMLPMDFANRYSVRDQRARALGLLEDVEIEEHARKLPSGLSGGQQQRLAIARAMANDPPILLADEPTGSLDSATASSVMAVFERLVEGGTTILLVTHDPDIARRGSRLVRLADGRIAA